MNTISHQQAKRFYDRLGSRQDWQGFYENPATLDMVAHSLFAQTHAVCEFGCGTGKLADILLKDHLPPDATYTALDISETMVRLATERLAKWGERAHVIRTEGVPTLPLSDHSVDRVVATYVLDLLSGEDIDHFLNEVRRVLTKDGIFCNVNLTFGTGPLSKAMVKAWQTVYGWQPTWLGGCRPLVLPHHLPNTQWQVTYHHVLCRFTICSEITVATPQ